MENYNQVNTVHTEEKSYFEGNYFAYIGINIVVSFVSMITLGIMFPWMFCWMQRWKARNTVISGKRLTFEGTGGRLFGKYILWALLTVVTFGIYSFWMSVALQKWITKYTHFENDPENNSYFDGGVGSYIGFSFLTMLVRVIPLVGFAWADIIWLRWETNHSVIDSRRLNFNGSVGGLFGKYLLWGLLTVVTFGIFGLFLPVKQMRWVAERTVIDKNSAEYINYMNTHTQNYYGYEQNNYGYEQNNYGYAQPVPTVPTPTEYYAPVVPVEYVPETAGETTVLAQPDFTAGATEVLGDSMVTETLPTVQPAQNLCANCGNELIGTESFCRKCGTKRADTARICPNCGKQVKENVKFCGYCGTPM